MCKSIKHSVLLLTLGLVGCTQSSQHLIDSFSFALRGHKHAEITQQQIQDIPYATLLLESGQNSPVLVVLAWAEQGAHNASPALKWLSAKNELIVTQDGRVVKTIGLDGVNSISILSEDRDPLAMGLHLEATPKTWSYQLSWSPGYHMHYHAHSTLSVHGKVIKSLPFGEQSLIHVSEIVDIPLISKQLSNEYWLHPVTGNVVASVQTPAPGMQPLTIYVAKPFGE